MRTNGSTGDTVGVTLHPAVFGHVHSTFLANAQQRNCSSTRFSFVRWLNYNIKAMHESYVFMYEKKLIKLEKLRLYELAVVLTID